MGRRLLQLSTLLILFFVKTTMAQDIPDAFRYQWEKAGLSQRKFSTTRTVNVKQVEASASEEISANELFEQALNELGGKSGTI
ncbi:MAG: hypothetical protein KDC92_15010, partial [Bacteroidetes bacterium]|nr:hypothetical protein [Bacteroidota bacterium]